MILLNIRYTDVPPMKPADADFGITINFRKGVDDPVVVFEAMTEFLQGFKEIDRLFFNAVDPDFEPITVLEDVEAASITSWVRNKLSAIDDQALKEFDPKQQIGKYAVKAKYRVIEYLDNLEVRRGRERLQQLRQDLYTLAAEASARPIPIPAEIPIERLVRPLDQIQAAKQLLPPEDTVTLRSNDHEHRVNLESTGKPSDLLAIPIPRESSGKMKMVLLVRKPDYLGDSLWEFRHGRNSLTAHIKDNDWLQRFREGNEIIVPGSALDCTVDYEYTYGEDGQVATMRHDIEKVHAVIQPPPASHSLLD